MYGLLGIIILTVMLAVLSVSTTGGMPDSTALLNINSALFSIPSLMVMAILLLFISQRGRRSAVPVTVLNTAPKFQLPFSTICVFLSVIRYTLMAFLAGALIVGSAWQALQHYQQAESTKINDTMRVMAWVTIEGISDSVYDTSGKNGDNSGYRQVAQLRSITPLVANMTAQDLNKATSDYLKSDVFKIQSKNGRIDNDIDDIQYRILLNAYPSNNKKAVKLDALNNLKPGDQLLMSLTLAPLKTSQQDVNNATGFDSYRWLRARHIDGVANIIAIGTPVQSAAEYSTLATSTLKTSTSYLQRFRLSIDQGRWQLRQHFYQGWARYSSAEQQARAVTLSLLTGDRSLINRETKDLYQLAGISHLLAISGTHVLFLAIVLAGLATIILDNKAAILYRTVPRSQIRWLVMISAAFIYALFTGFDVPAARTAWMLLAIGAVRLTLLPISTMRVLLVLAVIMAWQDPYVLWQAGYWLSFIAVALLLRYDDSSQLPIKNSVENGQLLSPSNNSTSLPITAYSLTAAPFTKQLWLRFKQLFKLQCWLFIALLPITLLLFGKASLWGLVVNLFAIGLFGWIIVPLNLLAGLCYLIAPVVADAIWSMVSAIVAGLHELISALTTLPVLKSAWLYTPFNTGMLLVALLVALPWLLPRGLLSRWLSLPPLTLLATTLFANQQALTLTPTLYILPTSDRYVTAAVLQYPVLEDNDTGNNKAKNNVSWLLLADHRLQGERTMPSHLTADKLSASLEQQLRTLSISRLEGIVVQTQVTDLTKPSTLSKPLPVKNERAANNESSLLLPLTVAKLTQNLPSSHYWQAGRSERWANIAMNNMNESATRKPSITAQRCEQDKKWQLPNGTLSLQALTGWSEIDDSSVWDCSLAIESALPIKIVQYNSSAPQQSLPLTAQNIITAPPHAQSRLIVDTSTHARVWQLWSLLCGINPLANSDASLNRPKHATTWLAHSASQVSADVLSAQPINKVVTYNNEPLEVALSLNSAD
ncbi:ComEC/Rec2 family competence protein [Psychrobacter sp. 16-MNA-CIBAN-0192]|uniref:ComEC/Rec2 family competence protein n=1 Tax=Psychrobacter sp. 16-MNA-CIBAN-0192 TaxID=3140448 RepID=UPI0033227E57